MTVLGFDSRYTETIPSDTEYEFAGIKISDGAGGGPYTQPLIQWERAGELGLDRLPFHYWRGPGLDDPERDGEEQARWFRKLYEDHFLPHGPAELPPVLDAEDRFSRPGSRALRSLMSFLDHTESLWGRKPLFYSAGWFFDHHIKPYTTPAHRIYTYELWEADPPPDTPIGFWAESESVIKQVRLDFPKEGFTAQIDENEAQDEWYAGATGGGSEPIVHRVIVPTNADVIEIVRS